MVVQDFSTIFYVTDGGEEKSNWVDVLRERNPKTSDRLQESSLSISKLASSSLQDCLLVPDLLKGKCDIKFSSDYPLYKILLCFNSATHHHRLPYL